MDITQERGQMGLLGDIIHRPAGELRVPFSCASTQHDPRGRKMRLQQRDSGSIPVFEASIYGATGRKPGTKGLRSVLPP